MPKSPPSRISETDLYRPVADYFTALGYTVQGEVRKCDIAAVKGDELAIVELKLRLSWEVLAQAAQRQEIADAVYIAIPRPRAPRRWRRSYAGLLYLVRRLELGLLLVSPTARKRPKVEIECPVRIFDRVKNGNLRAQVLGEVRRRGGDFNEGGSVRQQVVNSHREVAIHIACCIEKLGPLCLRDLQDLGTGPRTRSVLTTSLNIEGWFERKPDGTYTLKPEGRTALNEHADAAEHYRSLLDPA
jgi:hypothetical protein